jgi:hypothetical protein
MIFPTCWGRSSPSSGKTTENPERIGADLSAVARRAQAEGIIRRSLTITKRITPEPVVGPRLARYPALLGSGLGTDAKCQTTTHCAPTRNEKGRQPRQPLNRHSLGGVAISTRTLPGAVQLKCVPRVSPAPGFLRETSRPPPIRRAWCARHADSREVEADMESFRVAYRVMLLRLHQGQHEILVVAQDRTNLRNKVQARDYLIKAAANAHGYRALPRGSSRSSVNRDIPCREASRMFRSQRIAPSCAGKSAKRVFAHTSRASTSCLAAKT